MDYSSIIEAIEAIADPAWQESWDRSGLQVAAQRRRVNKIAVMLDPLPYQIKQALSSGAEFVLAHHPLALKPDLPDKLDNYHAVLQLLLSSDVPLYAAHTSLDVNPQGPAGWLGRELGMRDFACLDPTGIANGIGFGGVGDLPAPMRGRDLLLKIMSLTGMDYGLLCGPKPPELVKRVAWCGGSGAAFMKLAQERQADIYITGDIKHHAALEAPLPVFDIGHFGLEEQMMAAFTTDLQKSLPEVEVEFYPQQSPFRLERY